MRLVFLGTPDVAVAPLRALVAAGHDVALVVTRADRRRGRGSATSPSPVKAAAAALDIPVTHQVDDVLTADAELGVVVAYGRIIKPHVLEALPMVNVHFSLLPRWRGAAPVERALLAGDETTGVCIMDVEVELDTGGVYACHTVPIGPRATASTLRQELADVGTRLLVDVLAAPLGTPTAQTGTTTYADKITPEEMHLVWARPAGELDRQVRVGRAWTTFRGRRLKVHEVAVTSDRGDQGVLAADAATVGTGDGSVRLVSVQPEGRPVMRWSDFANGAHPRPGERLT